MSFFWAALWGVSARSPKQDEEPASGAAPIGATPLVGYTGCATRAIIN